MGFRMIFDDAFRDTLEIAITAREILEPAPNKEWQKTPKPNGKFDRKYRKVRKKKRKQRRATQKKKK